MTKARCPHGRPWFALCLTCDDPSVRAVDEDDLTRVGTRFFADFVAKEIARPLAFERAMKRRERLGDITA